MTKDELIELIEQRLNEMAIPSNVPNRYWTTTWLAARESVQIMVEELGNEIFHGTR